MQMYLMPRSQAKVFIDEMFMLFDADGNGTVSFKVRDLGLCNGSCSVNYDFVGICFGNQHDQLWLGGGQNEMGIQNI